MHTDGGYRCQFKLLIQIHKKIIPGFIWITVAGIHVFNVIAEFMIHTGNLKANALIPAFRFFKERVTASNAGIILNPGKPQKVLRSNISTS